MFTTQQQQDFKAALAIQTADQVETYHSHAYSTGYLESLCVEMLQYLPKRKQKEMIAQVERVNGDKKIKVKNCLSGQEVEIRRSDRGTCVDPSTERYHSM